MSEMVSNLLANIIPIGLTIWIFYRKERREKAKSMFHGFMNWIESGVFK